MMYRYETHLHTKEASACASVSGAEHARRCHALGYQGIIVTDHFFNGNCAVLAELPWEERVALFCRGYENARQEGEQLGLDVFFGWEANYSGAEFLIYGLDKEWLMSHPQVMEWSVEEQFRYVSEAGGLVIQAHPFREAPYIKEVRVFPDAVHGIEVYNAGNERRDPVFNARALRFAAERGLPMTAGTDAHGYETKNTGILCPVRLHNIQDYVRLIKSGTGYTRMD